MATATLGIHRYRLAVGQGVGGGTFDVTNTFVYFSPMAKGDRAAYGEWPSNRRFSRWY